jgi:hypothetical protein
LRSGWIMRQMPASVLRKVAVSKTFPYLLSSLS